VPYEVRLSRRAEKQLDRVPDRDADRIMGAILKLADEPQPRSAKRLSGRAPLSRLRVGEYRVIYSVFSPDRMVVVDSIVRRTTTAYKDIQ
jgi:mRNA interferase RelE/StbE